MLGCRDLSGRITTLDVIVLLHICGILRLHYSILAYHAIRNTVFTVVEVLHTFIDVVFLAHFGS